MESRPPSPRRGSSGSPDGEQSAKSPLGSIGVWWLFLAGTLLLSAGWFMKPFPVLMFIGLAPFFAILDHTLKTENFWENTELILLGLAIFLFTAFSLELTSLVKVIFLAIVFTLPFLGFAFIHESFGTRTGKFIVIILWLACEYVMLKVQWPKQTIFLADAFQIPSNWTRWNHETGYLGASAWIILANWIFYVGVLRKEVNWFFIVMGVLIVTVPIGYSFSLDAKPILRKDMLELYRNNTIQDAVYMAKGELVARTCAWLSVLIVLFAIVKSRVTKK
jgi:hypothetical protein